MQTSIIGIKQIYVDIVNSMHKRFEHLETEPNYCLATLLDPRLKSSVFLNQNNLQTAIQILIVEVNGMKSINENKNGMAADSQVRYYDYFLLLTIHIKLKITKLEKQI